MRYENATDTQLNNIFNHDKDCPTNLLVGVVQEMMNRKLLNYYIRYSIKSIKNLHNVLRTILKMEFDDLMQIGLITINEQAQKFRPGNRTPKTYFIMCLVSKFMKLLRDAKADKRSANTFTYDYETLDEKIQDALFRSPENIERYVINKLEVESYLSRLSEKERQAIIWLNEGYPQSTISKWLGYSSRNSANILIKRAYEKIRRDIA